MKNTFGNSISLTVFGESHGECVGAVIDGLAAGIVVDENQIREDLKRRAPSTSTDTARRENDNFKIVSGVFNGRTTGAPICVIVPNENTKSGDYDYGIARPSHADYTAFCKYHGYEDYRGGGHFSGRVTAGIVAAASIVKSALESIGINIATHVIECANVQDKPFNDIKNEILTVKSAIFPVIDKAQGKKMQEEIEKAATTITVSRGRRTPITRRFANITDMQITAVADTSRGA